jgi:transcriptional regulator with XRE-family HTH domain
MRDDRKRFLGHFDVEERAAEAYDAAVLEQRGQHAVLNFAHNQEREPEQEQDQQRVTHETEMSTDRMDSLRARVRTTLAQRGWTQDRFAILAGVGRSTLGFWLRRENRALESTVSKILIALDREGSEEVPEVGDCNKRQCLRVRVRDALVERGWSQGQFANSAGIGRSTLGAWLRDGSHVLAPASSASINLFLDKGEKEEEEDTAALEQHGRKAVLNFGCEEGRDEEESEQESEEDDEKEEKGGTNARAFTSQYRGVHWDKNRRKWKASIGRGGRNHALGSYDVEKDAAKAYDAAALEQHGRKAVLNFGCEEGGD